MEKDIQKYILEIENSYELVVIKIENREMVAEMR
jgi:hypothetical protein